MSLPRKGAYGIGKTHQSGTPSCVLLFEEQEQEGLGSSMVKKQVCMVFQQIPKKTF
jgi:hypothetical protein